MSKTFKLLAATPTYNKAICKLFALPMKGMISLSKERSPDFFAGAKIQNNYPESYIYVNQQNNDLAAAFSIGRREVYVEGVLTKMQYLSDLRIHPKYRGGTVGYVALNEIFGSCKLDTFSQTAVLSDNVAMLKGIEKLNRFCKKRDLAYYNYIGKIVTCILPLARKTKPLKPNKQFEIRWANETDIQTMQAFVNAEAPRRSFYPHYEFNQLNKHPYYDGLSIGDYLLVLKQGEIIGITGIWDQDEIWRTKVVTYDKKLQLARSFLNFYNRFKGGMHLPVAGSKLRNLYLHTILIKDNNPAIFESVLKHLNNKINKHQYDQIVLGLSEYDPLKKTLNAFKNKRILYGNYYLVTKDSEIVNHYKGKNFYMELARI